MEGGYRETRSKPGDDKKGKEVASEAAVESRETESTKRAVGGGRTELGRSPPPHKQTTHNNTNNNSYVLLFCCSTTYYYLITWNTARQAHICCCDDFSSTAVLDLHAQLTLTARSSSARRASTKSCTAHCGTAVR